MLDRLGAQSEPDDHVDPVADVIDAQLKVRAMAKLLDELPPGERGVLLLHAWEALTYEEIANALNIPGGTVRSRLNRTRRRLRAGVDEIDRIRSVRPDRLTTIPDATERRTMSSTATRRRLQRGRATSSGYSTTIACRLTLSSGFDAVTFRARKVEMIPLELVARRIATGSFLNRNADIADGTVFADLVFEIFEKDDVNHDPLLEFDFERYVLRRFVPNTKAALQLGSAHAGGLISQETLSHSRYATVTSAASHLLSYSTGE